MYSSGCSGRPTSPTVRIQITKQQGFVPQIQSILSFAGLTVGGTAEGRAYHRQVCSDGLLRAEVPVHRSQPTRWKARMLRRLLAAV